MPTTRSRRPDLATLHPLLALLQAQAPDAPWTLAQAEAAVLDLLRTLGPALLEHLLQQAPPPEAHKKGGRRSVRAASRCATTRPDPAD